MKFAKWFGKTVVMDKWFLSVNEAGRGFILVIDLNHKLLFDIHYWTPRLCPRLFVYITRGVFRIEPSLMSH